MKKVLQGNEAIARGAWEAGVTVACAYPGTPSSEILQELAAYKEVTTQWAPNEKVAVEVASGAALAGARAMACMKHVGLNVASDPFMTLAYTGIKGGFVIVVADDPNVHSSQNEQDSRNWARFAKVPMLEPADAAECKEFTKIAFDISEQFDTPVLLKGETRVSHSDSIVELGERKASKVALGLDRKDAPKYVMVPANVRVRRKIIEERMRKLEAYADGFSGNVMEINDSGVGVITAGAAYMYTKEVFPRYSYLKLGMVWPLPKKLLADFFKQVKKVIIVEELDPFLETEVKALGYKIFHGKDVVPTMYELSPEIVEKALSGKSYHAPKIRVAPDDLPRRPPNMCPGCSHRALFYSLKKLGAFVFGDIGCYTLASAPPLQALHSCVCMGASIGQAYGAGKALGKEGLGKICAVIGDSTFLHGGIAPVMDTVHHPRQQDDRHDGSPGARGHRLYPGRRAREYGRLREARPRPRRQARPQGRSLQREEHHEDDKRGDGSRRGFRHHHQKRALHAPQEGEEEVPPSLLHHRCRDVPRLQGLPGAGLSRHQLGRSRRHHKKQQEEKRNSLYQQDPVPRLRPLRAGL